MSERNNNWHRATANRFWNFKPLFITVKARFNNMYESDGDGDGLLVHVTLTRSPRCSASRGVCMTNIEKIGSIFSKIHSLIMLSLYTSEISVIIGPGHGLVLPETEMMHFPLRLLNRIQWLIFSFFYLFSWVYWSCYLQRVGVPFRFRWVNWDKGLKKIVWAIIITAFIAWEFNRCKLNAANLKKMGVFLITGRLYIDYF